MRTAFSGSALLQITESRQRDCLWRPGTLVGRRLAAQPQTIDQFLVTLLVLALEIVEQTPALADHF